MSGVLGCVQEYTVLALQEIVNPDVVTAQSDFGVPVGPLENITALTWDRRLDDTSEATIVMSINADCCADGFLNDLNPWHHGIAIFRDGEHVWDGPIVQITYSRTQVTIVARDISALWSKRILLRDLCFSSNTAICSGTPGLPNTPELVAFQLVRDAYQFDGHGGYDKILVDVSAVNNSTYEGSYKTYDGPIFDLVQKLASDFINWTVIGRTTIIARGGLNTSTKPSGFARTAMLTCDDFLTDGISVTKDGLAQINEMVEIGQTTVVNGVSTTNIGIGKGFPLSQNMDSYYGLLQGRRQGNTNLNTLGALNDAAQNLADGLKYPAKVLSGVGQQLAPSAPVTIAELVPGTFVPIFSDCLCVQVQQEFVLSKLTVSIDSTGEKVVPTFISKGSDNQGTLESDS